jgi:hypothetical protein
MSSSFREHITVRVGDNEMAVATEEEFLSTLAIMANMNLRRGVVIRNQLEDVRQQLVVANERATELEAARNETRSPPTSESKDSNSSIYGRWYWLVSRGEIDDFAFMKLPYEKKKAIPNCRVLPKFLLCREEWNSDYLIWPMMEEDVELSQGDMKLKGLTLN